MSEVTSSQSKWATMPRVLTLSVANFLSVSESVLMEKSCKIWYRMLNDDEKRWMREYERRYPVDASALVKRLSHGKDKLIAKHLIRANWTAHRCKKIKLDVSNFPFVTWSSMSVYGTTLYVLSSSAVAVESDLGTLYSVDLEAKDPKPTVITETAKGYKSIYASNSATVILTGASGSGKAIVVSAAQKTAKELGPSGALLCCANLDDKEQPTCVLDDYKFATFWILETDGKSLISIPGSTIKGQVEAVKWPYAYSRLLHMDFYQTRAWSLYQEDLRLRINQAATNDTNSNSQSDNIRDMGSSISAATPPTTENDNKAPADHKQKAGQQHQQHDGKDNLKPLLEHNGAKPRYWPHYSVFGSASKSKDSYRVYDLDTGRLLQTLVTGDSTFTEFDQLEPVRAAYNANNNDLHFWDLRTGKLIATLNASATSQYFGIPQARFSSDCVVLQCERRISASSKVPGPDFLVYLFTDGVEEAVNKIRSARARVRNS